MMKYLTRWHEIEIVLVERESDSCVWINGRKHMKRTDYECYHDTEEQAKRFIIEKAEREVNRIAGQLRYAERKLQMARQATVKH